MKRRTVHFADVLVIGAGVAGLSTAYHLSLASPKKKILILEQEKKLGGHASGRNAGMIRQAVTDPFIAILAARGRRELAAAPGRGWKKLEFRSNGSLLLAQKDKTAELEKIRRVLRYVRVPSRIESRSQAAARVPLLEGGRFEKALFCPSDALVEIGPLLAGFRTALRRQGVGLWLGARPRSIVKEKGVFRVVLKDREIVAHQVVNAAGAWCALLARRIGAQKIPLVSYRRHLYLSRPLQKSAARWPFVWDLSRQFYFRPEGRSLLLSPCDTTPADKKSLTGRREPVVPAVERSLARKLAGFSVRFEGLGLRSAKSGLRTMTPDGRFVIGEDGELPGFYWVAGLGGHGVTTCFSVGKLSGDIILGRKTDPGLTQAFSPRRFLKMKARPK